MINVIAAIAATYAAAVGVLYLAQRQLIYFPDASRSSPVASGVGEMEEVTLSTADGLTLKSWYQAAPAAMPTIVYLCGNAGHIGYRGPKVRPYLDAGFGVLLVGYRGYGGNPGSPTEEGLYADGRAALGFLAARGVPTRSWVLYGESLGAGVAVHLAAAPEEAALAVAAIVLEAPFASMADAAADHYPWVPARWLVKDRFDSIDKIARLKAPLLIVHGEDDRVISVDHGRRLFDLAPEPKEGRWFKGGDHNDLYDFGASEAVVEFLRRRLKLPATR